MGDFKEWPRLTDMPGPRHPRMCQSCGHEDADLDIWQEHDMIDHPEYKAIVLCQPCSDKLIEPHPRLYKQLSIHWPYPGLMAICIDCKYRVGTHCPVAKFNGGPGVMVNHPEPFRMHIDGTRNGKRYGEWITRYSGPATECSGREVTPTPRDKEE